MAAIAVAGGLAGCGSKLPPPSSSDQLYLPNIGQIELAMAQSVQARYHVAVTVLCPATIPEITGEKFSCIGFSRGDRRTFTFLATDQGYTYVAFHQTS